MSSVNVYMNAYSTSLKGYLALSRLNFFLHTDNAQLNENFIWKPTQEINDDTLRFDVCDRFTSILLWILWNEVLIVNIVSLLIISSELLCFRLYLSLLKYDIFLIILCTMVIVLDRSLIRSSLEWFVQIRMKLVHDLETRRSTFLSNEDKTFALGSVDLSNVMAVQRRRRLELQDSC